MRALSTTITRATQFVREIAKGNLEVDLDDTETASELNTSLISMRDQMKNFSLAEQERRWVNEGLAQFVEILRSRNNDTLKSLSDSILKNLVTYLKANQGALFLLNDDDPKDVFLEMTACYAYDRKKFIEKKVGLGEGIAGQAVLERDTVYLTDIPTDFIKITSGLGEATPRNILVVPLKLEEKVYGVVEMASFNLLKPYQIEFVEKLGESIASTIAGVRASERTKTLLAETQSQAEEMRAQEEELRQNMEELSSTQEEMQRILNEVQRHERFTKGILDSSSDMIVTIDRDYKVTNFNKAMYDTFKQAGLAVENGFDITNLVKPEDRARHIEKYEQAFKGQQVSLQEHYVFEGVDQYLVFVFTPIRNEKNEIHAVSIFAKDVTEIIRIKNKVEESERYLTNLLNVTTDPTMTIDREYKLVLFNKLFQEQFTAQGLPIEVGFNILNTFGEAIIPERKKLYNRVFQGEVIEITEHLPIGGKDYYFQTKHAPIYDSHGKINTIAIIARDITELTLANMSVQEQNEQLKAQEEELRQNMEELSATQETISQQFTESEKIRQDLEIREMVLGVTTILSESDLFGNITYVNDKLCEISQYSREEMIGKPHNIFRHPDMPKALFKKLWTAIKAGKEFRAVIKNKKKDGSHYWVDATLMPVKNEEGEIYKYISARYHLADDAYAERLFEAQLPKRGWLMHND